MRDRFTLKGDSSSTGSSFLFSNLNWVCSNFLGETDSSLLTVWIDVCFYFFKWRLFVHMGHAVMWKYQPEYFWVIGPVWCCIMTWDVTIRSGLITRFQTWSESDVVFWSGIGYLHSTKSLQIMSTLRHLFTVKPSRIEYGTSLRKRRTKTVR